MCYKCSEKDYGCSQDKHEKIIKLLHIILEKLEDMEEHLDESQSTSFSQGCSHCSCNEK